MAINWIKQFFLFIILILLQVLVLNHISVLGYATPFLYIYFIIKVPFGVNRNLLMLLGFCLGFIIDVFCNTPGQNTAATVLAAFMRQPIQQLFIAKEDFEHFIPRMSNLGSAFVKYTCSIVFIHHTMLIVISSFSFINWSTISLRVISSFILTSIIIFTLEGFSKKRIYE